MDEACEPAACVEETDSEWILRNVDGTELLHVPKEHRWTDLPAHKSNDPWNMETSMRETDFPEDSRIEFFIRGVTSKLHNCDVFFDFEIMPGAFSAGVLVFFRFGDRGEKMLHAHLVTSNIGLRANNKNLNREIDIVADAIAKELGKKVFRSDFKPIPSDTLNLIVRNEQFR